MAQNLIDLLIRNAREFPKRPALREKRYGVWTPTTWKQLAEEVLYLISYADARIIVLSDQEQVDKILKVWPKISGAVKAVIVWDSRGMSHYYAAHSFLKRFEEVLEMGAEEGKNHPDSLQQAAGDVPPGTPAMMLTTSGTTALPKLAILSHESLLYAGESYGKVVSMEPEDQLLSLAPLPWIGEQLYAVVRWLLSGACYNFPEEPETLRRDLIELQPSYFGGTPSRWEDLVSVIQAAMDNADPLKKNLYGWAVRAALKRTEDELAGKDPGLWTKFLFGLLNFSVLRALRNRVGLGRVKMAVTGGGALSPEVFKYFKSLGIDIRQVYGQTECAGIPYTTYQDLSQRPEVYELVREEIRKLCQRFPQNMRVRKFAILLKELHPDDEELTRTRKVRRGLIYERYKPLIEDLYQPTPEHLLDIQIRYEDGRISSLKGRVAIAEVTS